MLQKKYKLEYKDIAVLYRTSFQSREIEDKLLMAGIPYQIVGGLPFYARKEVKDILSYARLIYNPFDYEAFKRCITTPKRGIADSGIEKILDYARHEYSQPINFIQACQEVELKGKAKKGLEEFNETIDQLIKDSEGDTAAQFIRHVIEYTDYNSILYADKKNNPEEKIANLIELQEIAHQFENLEDMLQNSSLGNIDESENDDNDKVQLMTMHASKGLEYKAVIIIGACEGTCPYWRAETEKQLEEERRLFYVAMTRAQKYLFITGSRYIKQMGQNMRVRKSRFVTEIDQKYIQKF
jgi:DNA helicase-2/ATP-dependent DNA helicase PcrA